MNTPSRTLHELVRRYAIHAREFSDEVAILGKDKHLEAGACRGRLDTIRSKLDLCVAIADEIDRHSKEKADAANAK